MPWGSSSVGRASRSQCEGQGFDSPLLHHFPVIVIMPIGPCHDSVFPCPSTTPDRRRSISRSSNSRSLTPAVEITRSNPKGAGYFLLPGITGFFFGDAVDRNDVCAPAFGLSFLGFLISRLLRC
jgi:hypothetical protein